MKGLDANLLVVCLTCIVVVFIMAQCSVEGGMF